MTQTAAMPSAQHFINIIGGWRVLLAVGFLSLAIGIGFVVAWNNRPYEWGTPVINPEDHVYRMERSNVYHLPGCKRLTSVLWGTQLRSLPRGFVPCPDCTAPISLRQCRPDLVATAMGFSGVGLVATGLGFWKWRAAGKCPHCGSRRVGRFCAHCGQKPAEANT